MIGIAPISSVMAYRLSKESALKVERPARWIQSVKESCANKSKTPTLMNSTFAHGTPTVIPQARLSTGVIIVVRDV